MCSICVSMCSLSLSLSCVVCGCRPTLSRCRPTRAHTLSFCLCLSLTWPIFLSFKKALRRRYGYHWNTRFDCIRLFSFHIGSTNTKNTNLSKKIFHNSIKQTQYMYKNLHPIHKCSMTSAYWCTSWGIHFKTVDLFALDPLLHFSASTSKLIISKTWL